MEDNYDKDNDDISMGMLCCMVKCECGMSVMCVFGQHEDGDLLEHSGCKLNTKNRALE